MADTAARDTTFCFTDIAGSTDILRRLGESAYDALLERHRELIRQALRASGGQEIKTEGDGFFVTFHDAGAALRFAAGSQQALAAEPWPVPVRVRMGLHRGPGTARPDGDYSSLAAHQAARVAAAAHGGQVLLTAEVVRDVDPPDGISLVHLGSHRLRDFDQGVELLQLAATGLDHRFPPVRATRNDHGLPLPRTTMVGRERELRDLRLLLTTHPVVTLHGPGGVGKTRLALEAAAATSASFPDGLHFVELSPLDDPGLVASTVASAVGVRPSPGQEVVAAVVAHLSVGSHLLVLDSAERVIDEVARLVDAVTRACPACTVLVTSTELVRTPEERVVAVDPLPLPAEGAVGADVLASAAVRLLVLRAANRGATVGEDREDVEALATIARRLDGIPLGLELAAGRIADLGLTATLDGLDDRFSLLTNGWRTALPRHRTLEAMVEWTAALLPDDERRLLVRLSTLHGHWLPDAAAAVCGEGAGVEDVLRLVDRSLLWLDDSVPLPRVRMFDTVRAYVERQLDDEDARRLRARTRRWLVDFVTGLIDEPDEHIRRELGHLIPDLRRAMTIDPDDDDQARLEAVDVAAGTAPWFESAGMWAEAVDRVEAAVAAAPPSPQRSNALSVLAHLSSLVGDVVSAHDHATTVLAAPDAPDRARALAYIALSTPGAPAGDGLDYLEEAIRLSGSPTSSLALAARVRLGLRKIAMGDAEGAIVEFTDLAEVAAQHGRSMHRAQALVNLGGAMTRMGRLDEAEAILLEGREVALDQQLPKLAAGCLTNLGMIAHFRGDPARAVVLGEERLAISLAMGDMIGAASARTVIGNAAAALGDRGRAREEHRQAYDIFRKLGMVEGCATALFNLVTLADADGDPADAARTAAELARLAAPTTNPSIHELALRAAGAVGAAAGRIEAAEVLGAAEAHAPATSPLDPTDHEWLARCEAVLVAATSEEACAAARARGAALAVELALDRAASLADELAAR